MSLHAAGENGFYMLMAFYIFEGLIINVIIFTSYIVIYRRLRAYHCELIEYNDLSPEDVEILH